MRDDGRRRRHLLRPRDQPLVLRGGRGCRMGRLPRSCRSRCLVGEHDQLLRCAPLADVALMMLSPGPACRRSGTSARLRAAADPRSTPNSWATSFIRCLSSAENSPRAPQHLLDEFERLAPGSAASGGSIDGIAASAAFLIDQQHVELLAHERLEGRQRHVAVRARECGARSRIRVRRPQPAPMPA